MSDIERLEGVDDDPDSSDDEGQAQWRAGELSRLSEPEQARQREEMQGSFQRWTSPQQHGSVLSGSHSPRASSLVHPRLSSSSLTNVGASPTTSRKRAGSEDKLAPPGPSNALRYPHLSTSPLSHINLSPAKQPSDVIDHTRITNSPILKSPQISTQALSQSPRSSLSILVSTRERASSDAPVVSQSLPADVGRDELSRRHSVNGPVPALMSRLQNRKPIFSTSSRNENPISQSPGRSPLSRSIPLDMATLDRHNSLPSSPPFDSLSSSSGGSFESLTLPEQVILATSPAPSSFPDPPIDADEPWVNLSRNPADLRSGGFSHDNTGPHSFSGTSGSSSGSISSPRGFPRIRPVWPPTSRSHSYSFSPAARSSSHDTPTQPWSRLTPSPKSAIASAPSSSPFTTPLFSPSPSSAPATETSPFDWSHGASSSSLHLQDRPSSPAFRFRKRSSSKPDVYSASPSSPTLAALRIGTDQHRPPSPNGRPGTPDRSLRRSLQIDTLKRAASPTGSRRRSQSPSPVSPSIDMRRSPSPKSPSPKQVRSPSTGTFSEGEDESHAHDIPSPVSPEEALSPHEALVRNPALSLPPPSGWDLSDDPDADESGTESSASSASTSSDEGDRGRRQTKTGSAQKRELRSGMTHPLQRMMTDDSEATSDANDKSGDAVEEEESSAEHPWTSTKKDSLDMQRDESLWAADEANDGEQDGIIDESGLTALERIFLYAKSEQLLYRETVARSLSSWLENADLVEAVEFVIPVLSDLAMDDDLVKEALAEGFDRILRFFYTNCPVSESSAPNGNVADAADSPKHSARGRPRLSSKAFHEVLGYLLLCDAPNVSQAAQDAVVRFMAWLGEHSTIQAAEAGLGDRRPLDEAVVLKPYALTPATRSLVLEAFLDGIVIALVKLDESSEAPVVKMVKSASNSTASSRVQTPQTDGGESVKSGSFFDVTDNAAEASPLPSVDTEQGQFVALCIIGGLADSGIVAAEVLRERILPLVTKITRHPSDLLRKQAAETLALMLQWLDDSTIGKTFMTNFKRLAHDNEVGVRRAVCNLMSDIAVHLTARSGFGDFIVDMAEMLYDDADKSVVQALLEQMGPLIYAFLGKTVPDALIDIFLGARAASGPLEYDWDVAEDNARAIITAYNFPGIAITLKAEAWPRIRDMHARLLDSTLEQPRYLLASSLHDIAAVLTPQQISRDLLPVFERLAAAEDVETVSRALENCHEWFGRLESSSIPSVIRLVSDMWHVQPRPLWRTREMLAQALPALASHLSKVPASISTLLDILEPALKDEFTSVRLAAASAVGECAVTLKTGSHILDLRNTLEQLRCSDNHKHRALFATCCLSVVAHERYVDHPQPFWAPGLSQLAHDRIIDVRIAVARAVHRAKVDLESTADALDFAFTALQNDSEAVVREILLERSDELSKYRLPYSDDVISSDSSSITSSEDSDDKPSAARAAYTLTAASLYKTPTESTNPEEVLDMQTSANGDRSDTYDSDTPDILLNDDDDLDELDLTSSTHLDFMQPSPESCHGRTSPPGEDLPNILSSLASPLTAGESDAAPSPYAKSLVHGQSMHIPSPADTGRLKPNKSSPWPSSALMAH